MCLDDVLYVTVAGYYSVVVFVRETKYFKVR